MPRLTSSDGIDASAWEFAGQLTRIRRSRARRGLRAAADLGLNTGLNAPLSYDQVKKINRAERAGLYRLWKEAVARGLRTLPIPDRKSGNRPPSVDADAWDYASFIPDPYQARRGLTRLAALGAPTDLDATPTREALLKLSDEECLALDQLWSQAAADKRRNAAVPVMRRSTSRPSSVDARAWGLANSLRGWRAPLARHALRRLDKKGLPTTLDAVIPMAGYLALTPRERLGVRELWTAASDEGLRTAAVPDEQTAWMYRRDLEGIDRETIAFVGADTASRVDQFMLVWLRRLRDAGLPTDLNVDLEAPAVADLIEQLLTEAANRTLLNPEVEQLYALRSAIRRLYSDAVAHTKRSRGLPSMLAERQYARGGAAALVARLPPDDRALLTKVTTSLRELNRKQQAQRGDVQRTGTRLKKKTEAQSTSNSKISALNSFLHHAARWEADDRKHGLEHSPWEIQLGLESLLTPDNLARWAYRGHKPDGTRKAKRTCEMHHQHIVRLLERCAEARAPLVSDERLNEIKAVLTRVHDEEEWNVDGILDRDFDETGKWFPTLEQLRSGVAQLRDDWQRAKLQYENGGTFRRYWRACRDYVMAYGDLVCMWRVDTVATIDLSRCERDPNTDRVRWTDGGIRIRYGARAKQGRGHSYLVELLLIPGEVVDVIEMLLELEGRSLEQPLRAGERPVVLKVGDRYGRDALLETNRTIVPLFRAQHDRPAGLGVGGVSSRLQGRLFAMGWDAINPHTLRAAGAIEWRFVRGASYEAIMRLGNWHDERVLRRCYARLSSTDVDLEIANGAPSHDVVAPVGSAELAAALDQALTRTLALRQRPAAPPHEIMAMARSLRLAASRLEQAVGNAGGTDSPNPFRSHEDLVRVDALLRSHMKGGINEAVGYEVLRPTRVRRTKAPRQQRRMLARLQSESRRSSNSATRRTA